MILIYRKAGIAVVLVTLLMMGIFQAMYPEAYRNDRWPLGAAFIAAGAVLLPVGFVLNRTKKEVVPASDELSGALPSDERGDRAGREVTIPGGQHTLFGIRMEAWVVVLILGGLALVLI